MVDVSETALRTHRGLTVPGIRIALADGSMQDVRVTADRALRATHPGATPAGAVVLDLLDARARARV